MTGPTESGRLCGAEILQDPLVQELVTARIICVLATIDWRDAIHAAPMWFAAEDESIVLATSQRSRKVSNLEYDSRATLVVHDSRAGFEVCGAAISGRVDIIRGAAGAAAIESVHRRYVSSTALENELVHEFLASDDVALRLLPESAWTWDQRSTAANEVLRAIGGALPLLSTEPRR